MNRRGFHRALAGGAALTLTRRIALVEEPPPPALDEARMLQIVHSGLPKAERPQEIVIVGAGMAGLVAGYELLRAGHKPVLLEASCRVGGRVRTLRDPFTHGLHAEAGAMRVPAAHALTRAYIANAPSRGSGALVTSPFTMVNPAGYAFFRGRRHRWRHVGGRPDLLGFALEDRRKTGGLDERGKNAAQLWSETVAPIRERLSMHGPAAWSRILAEYDGYSTRGFLEKHGWSEEAIAMYGLVGNQQARMNNSVVSLLRETLTGSFEDLVEIKGGMDLLPRSFLPALAAHTRFGARMEAIEQSDRRATVHYRDSRGDRRTVSGDRVILAVPFPILRHVEGIEHFSNRTRFAIETLNYDASGKILLQCRRRFWEDDDKIFGGPTGTDLGIRSIWYPDHGRETGRGVLLVSYTWAKDAQRWGHLGPEERIRQAIEDLGRIHPQVASEDGLVEGGTSVMWQNEEFAGGAFALFDPRQESLLHETMRQAEGRIHFAGEHTSLKHRWIQGAIESGLQAASDVSTLA